MGCLYSEDFASVMLSHQFGSQYEHVASQNFENLQEYELKLDLNGEVDPSKSRHTILKSKLEIVLQKAANVSWPKLMADEHQQTASPILQVPVQQPSYPTSFKRCAPCIPLPVFLAI